MEASGAVGRASSGCGKGRGSLTIGAEALSSELEGGGSRSQREDVAVAMAFKQSSVLPTVTSLTPTCMRLESTGAVVLTMWTLGVDVERMRCSGGLAGAGKEKCSWSRCWVKGLIERRL